MDGPTYYRKAETLMAEAEKASTERGAQIAQRAQVYATLAQTAAVLDVAVIDAGGPAGAVMSNADEWANVMETEPEQPEKKTRSVFLN